MFARAVLVLTSAAAASCGAAAAPVVEAKKCEIQTVSMSVIASPRINPTLDGEARPVQMRIYQLKDDVRLQSASFEAVWKEDAKALAGDIVKRDEIFVYPSTRTDFKFDRDPTALHVVGAALFREPKGRSWFMSFDLPPPPGKGDCSIPGCTGPNCGANPNPRFSMWLDETRVQDGAGHLDDVRDGTRVRVIQLTTPSPEAAASGASPSTLPTN
jgi:type VI secretion system protein VasD